MRSVLRGPDSDFPEDLYRPEAQLRLGQALHEEGVSVCIDTSDGLWSSLALLSDLNPGCSFSLNWQEDLLHRRAKTYFEALRYPLLSLWVFEHGDYQLLFGAPTEVWARLEARNLPVRQLGRVLAGAEHSRLQVAQATFTVDLSCGRRVLNPGLREDGSEVPWQERAQELFSILRAANLP
jgi:thiamine monophosphate kinase